MSEYRMCTVCVMDTVADPDIYFDEKGQCNYCKDYYNRENEYLVKEDSSDYIEKIFKHIKETQRNSKYDCLLGLSGGKDSSYIAYLAKKYNLRTLLVHIDFGWNSEISENNVDKIVKYTGFDIIKSNIDWNEYVDIHKSYFKSSVVDIEVPTDHALRSSLYNIGNDNGIKYHLKGGNYIAEHIMPKSWYFQKMDLLNLKSIHNKYGSIPLRKFPTMGYSKWFYYVFINGIKDIYPLNYIKYNPNSVKKILQNEVGWIDYGKKHNESIFTKFFQCYILPTKFGIDKRHAHLSNLVCSGIMTRDEALKELEKPLYVPEELEATKQEVLKKWEMTQEEFDYIMALPRVEHTTFPSNTWVFTLMKFGKSVMIRTGIWDK
jgi:N-acetyl sugar amidotransferase